MCSLNYRTGTDGRECGNGQAPIHHQDWENNRDGMLHWWCMRHITCVHGRQCYTHTHTHTFIKAERCLMWWPHRNRSRRKRPRLAVHKTIPSSFIQQVLVVKGLWCDRHRCRCWRHQGDMRVSTLVALRSSGRQKINGDNRQSVKMWKVLRKKQKKPWGCPPG